MFRKVASDNPEEMKLSYQESGEKSSFDRALRIPISVDWHPTVVFNADGFPLVQERILWQDSAWLTCDPERRLERRAVFEFIIPSCSRDRSHTFANK